MVYDLTQFNSTNARTNLDLVEGVNAASGGLFFVLILFAIFLISFIMIRKSGYEGSDTFVASSFITMCFGGLLFVGGLLDWYYVGVCFSIFIISLVIKFVSK